MKRFLILLLSLLLVFSQGVYAVEQDAQALIDKYVTDGVDSDRIYEYDYMIQKEEAPVEDNRDTLAHQNAVNVVLALELMYNDSSGSFNENAFMPYDEFVDIISKISTRAIDESSTGQTDSETRFATHNEAAYHMVAALGYDVYDSKYKGENPRSICAKKIGIFDGIEFSGNRNITRGEMAQIIYNSLQIDVVDQTAFGDVNEYDIVEGNTLLDIFYDSEIVYGMVTAQNGFDLYSSGASLDSQQIKINNALYNAESINLSKDFLGHNVIALIKKDHSGKIGNIEMLEFDELDQTVTIAVEDLVDVRGNYVYYETGEETKKISISSVEKSILNGEAISTSELADLLLSDFEGDIRFCSEKDGKADAVVIYGYSTYKVASNSVLNEKISFADGRIYDGSAFISYENDENIRVTKNGEPASVSDIAAGNIISVVQNPPKTHMMIKISTNSVVGKVEKIKDDKVIIDGIPYRVSDAYEEARKNNSALKELGINVSGKFLLDCGNRIVSMSSDGGEYLYGFMTKIGSSRDGFKEKIMLRVFTMENEWQSIELADKLTLDGNESTTKEVAFEQLQKTEDIICNNPIRYKLSGKGEAVFLDTLYESVAEADDSDRMRISGTWNGEFNWSVTSERIYLRGNINSLSLSSTKVFTVPSDLKREDKGFSYGPPAFTSYTTGNLKIYNSDDFHVSPLVVSVSGGGSTQNFNDITAWSLVCGTFIYVDEEGEIQKGVELFDGSRPPNWVKTKVRIHENIIEEAATLKPGDIINIVTDGDVLTAFQMACKAEDINTDSSTALLGSTGQTLAVGTVVAIDAERDLVKIVSEGSEVVYRKHSLALWDNDAQECQMIEVGDIEVGDRVFCAGGSQLMRILVVR